jgi:hypothetical protein
LLSVRNDVCEDTSIEETRMPNSVQPQLRAETQKLGDIDAPEPTNVLLG